MDIGQTVGGIGGTIAGGALLGPLDGPLPFMDIIGAGIGGAIGADIGKAIGGKGKKQKALKKWGKEKWMTKDEYEKRKKAKSAAKKYKDSKK